jgi:hypothetical protein
MYICQEVFQVVTVCVCVFMQFQIHIITSITKEIVSLLIPRWLLWKCDKYSEVCRIV